MDEEGLRLIHKTIKRVSERLESMRFNTAVAELMAFVNHLSPLEEAPLQMVRTLLLLLYPLAPHLASELWESVISREEELTSQKWPEYDPNLARDVNITIAIQVNGKLRDTVTVPDDTSEERLLELVFQQEKVQRATAGQQVKKTIYVSGKIVNIVTAK